MSKANKKDKKKD